jgi:hypothetical protein
MTRQDRDSCGFRGSVNVLVQCVRFALQSLGRVRRPDGGRGGGRVKQAPRRLRDSFPSKLTAAKARDESIDSQGRQERDMASHEGEEREKKGRRKTNAIAKCCSYKIHVQAILHANISAIFFLYTAASSFGENKKETLGKLIRCRLSSRWAWPAATSGLQESPRGPCACRRAQRQGRPRACAQAQPSCPPGHLAGCAEHG